MDGLEAVEVKLSEVFENNAEFRIDSDFFSKKFIWNEDLLRKINAAPLSLYIDELRSFGAYSLTNQIRLVENGVPFIRCTDIKAGNVAFENVLHIDNRSHKVLWKSEVKPRTVLVTMSGTVGNIAVAQEEWKYPINSNQDVAKISVTSLNPFYLATYLKTKEGRLQMERLQAGAIQQHLYLSQIEKLKIVILDNAFQNNIEEQCKPANIALSDSQSLYSHAESLLLEALELKDWQPTKESVAVRNLKNSFLATGRLDAEYYQPKYAELVEKVNRYVNGAKNLDAICNIKDKNYFPEDSKRYKYIELSNIGIAGEITGYTEDYGHALPTRARRLVETGDVIVSSIEGSLKSCAIVPPELDGALCSTGFYVLSSEALNPETLLVLMKSTIIQDLLKQGCSGTILTSINRPEFGNIILPVIDINIQVELATLVQESFALKNQSRLLLERAKRAVEVAIEEGEEAGMNILNQPEISAL